VCPSPFRLKTTRFKSGEPLDVDGFNVRQKIVNAIKELERIKPNDGEGLN
jgi:hypothetical protein